jgi:hypothetical protein
VGGHEALGRFYRGIIVPTLRQYTLLGDFAAQTDGVVFDTRTAGAPALPVGAGLPGSADDRWVFTEQNPERAIRAATGLAAAARVLKGYNDTLAADCLRIAEQTWTTASDEAARLPPRRGDRPSERIGLAVELLITTNAPKYGQYLTSQRDTIVKHIGGVGWVVGRALPLVRDAAFTAAVTEAVKAHRAEVERLEKKTPYGVPYEPDIWGAGWGIQAFGMRQYFLHTGFPQIFTRDLMLHALNFVLGCHPGPNTASFVSGVGSRSTLVAYGMNRADWSYIPGGSASGTALIRPDFPELLEWPFLWQQTEYVLGGGTTDYLFLVLAADHLLNAR